MTAKEMMEYLIAEQKTAIEQISPSEAFDRLNQTIDDWNNPLCWLCRKPVIKPEGTTTYIEIEKQWVPVCSECQQSIELSI